MTKDELEKNLGTIAKSGSFDFKTENQSDNIDIIGQFGVGSLCLYGCQESDRHFPRPGRGYRLEVGIHRR